MDVIDVLYVGTDEFLPGDVIEFTVNSEGGLVIVETLTITHVSDDLAFTGYSAITGDIETYHLPNGLPVDFLGVE